MASFILRGIRSISALPKRANWAPATMRPLGQPIARTQEQPRLRSGSTGTMNAPQPQEDLDNIAEKGIAFTIRSVFVIDPSKNIGLTMMYPPSIGRKSAEVLHAIGSLQAGNKKGVVTPIDCQVGDDVIFPPSFSTEDAKKKFGNVREVKPYWRFTKA
ncbi:putative thioredoxin peroxidase, mitochondrial isoform [Fusarium bulbicola]|nr:putative thioredoxin peroxidase, mitochondrial isoform [Fusarium bulbicola]